MAISGLAILGLVFLAAIWAGSESDAAALDRQRQLVNERLLDQVQRVSQEIQLMGAGYASLLAADQGAANARVAGLDQGTSPESAETFGKIATTVFGYNAAFLVTPSGEMALRTDAETSRRFKWVRPLLLPLIQDIEAGQGKVSRQRSSAREPSRVELMRLEGRPSVAGVVSVTTPDTGTAGKSRGARLYLVVFRFLDGATLDALSREQGLAGARYARTADQEKNEVAFQIEATATSEPIGFIIWEPDLPGSRVIARLVPVLSVAGLVIAALFFALMARLRRSMRELSASEHHARHLSYHDVLTGLPNRALFASRLEECLLAKKSAGTGAAMALIDLDHFKEVNDTHGHPAGDELLRAATGRVRALLGPEVTFARLGGDEFALLIPELHAGSHAHIVLCNAVIEALSKPFQLEDCHATVRIGCSIGATVFHDTGLAASEILRRADVALYEVKTNGRGRVVEYETSLDHLVEAKENLRNDLRLVLDGNADASGPVGQLEVFFQGVHRAKQGGLSGAEALVRWRHPLHGLLSPDKFIPLAEEAGMIDQLGEWVLKNAAMAATEWPHDMSVAVNVSPSQFRHRGFDARVLSILAETGLTPSRLELELTEAALFDIDDHAQAALARLRACGIRIALDDFGTGYSSLSHLVEFNIDRIKIDRSFVRLLGTQAEGAAIVSAILTLSRTLGKTTTAEGVETDGQRDFLVAAGCDDLQGFFLSRPIPAHEFSLALKSIRTEGASDAA